MSKRDARHLSPEAQEDLRRRVMSAIDAGMGISQTASTFKVSRQAIYNWMGRVDAGGRRALKSRRRGRPEGIALLPHQAATVVRMILGSCPDQLRLPFALWTREAVQMREAAGKHFVAGIVLYDGTATINFGDDLFAVPVRKLWEPA